MSDAYLERLKEFTDKLSLIKFEELFSPINQCIAIESLGAAIALKRYIAVNIKVYFGAYALTKAYATKHQGLWKDYIKNPLLIRGMYFEQAIEAYNKVLDYIYQILYFNFELYEKLDRKSIKSKEDVKKLAESIKNKKKLARIKEKLLKSGEEAKCFISKLEQYKKDTQHTRNLANDIKHKGCFAIEGQFPSPWGIATKEIDGEEVNLTEIVEPRLIKLDSEIAKLVVVHEKTYALLQDIYQLCNFRGKLEKLFNN